MFLHPLLDAIVLDSCGGNEVNWYFNHEGEWTAWSDAKKGLQYRIVVCDDGTFDVSRSDHGLTNRKETFQALRNAKAFCETEEKVHLERNEAAV